MAGAGKSSVVGALLRLTEIEAGQILIDSVDIRDVRLARLRSAVGVVPQSAFLFEARLLPAAHLCGPNWAEAVQLPKERRPPTLGPATSFFMTWQSGTYVNIISLVVSMHNESAAYC